MSIFSLYTGYNESRPGRPRIDWEERQRREREREKRHKATLRRQAEKVCRTETSPVDFKSRLERLVDGNGRMAKCHRGSDRECDPNDEVVESSWNDFSVAAPIDTSDDSGDDLD